MRINILVCLSILIISSSFSIKTEAEAMPLIKMVNCTEIECFTALLDDNFIQYDTMHSKHLIQYNYYPQSEFIDGELREFPENRLVFGIQKDKKASIVQINTKDKALFDKTLGMLRQQGCDKVGSTDWERMIEDIYSSKDDIYMTISTRVYEDLTMDDDLTFNISLRREH